MVEPEIWQAIDWLVEVAASHGLVVLPEVHDVPATHRKLVDRGYWTYDFALPGLVLHAFETGDPARLAAHLAASPERQFTMLDCHDGVPVNPDLEGILEPHEMRALADAIVARGGNINRILSAEPANGVDVHQLNCTLSSALGEDDDRLVAARAIQLFAPGIPQVYYVGLLAGSNDHDAVERTGEGRAINRHDFSMEEVASALERPVVRRILELIRLRANHPAFQGELDVERRASTGLRLTWTHGPATCRLDVDLASGTCAIDEG
jgi:sucrose phosphorylase